MALISCGECGGKVSTQAAACPQCGAPPIPPLPVVQPAAKSEFRAGLIAFVVIITVLAVVVWGLRKMNEPDIHPPKAANSVRQVASIMADKPTPIAPSVAVIPAYSPPPPAVVPEKPLPEINAEIRINGDELQVFNSGPLDWPKYTIFINGLNGYRKTGYRMTAGLGNGFQLNDFVDSDDNRFLPRLKNVREVIIIVPGMKPMSWSH